MGHVPRLAAQQLVLAATAAPAVAGSMLSAGSRVGFLPLALAALRGVGAFLKSRPR